MLINFVPHGVVDHTEFLERGGQAESDSAAVKPNRFSLMKQNQTEISIDPFALIKSYPLAAMLCVHVFHQVFQG